LFIVFSTKPDAPGLLLWLKLLLLTDHFKYSAKRALKTY